MRIKALILIGVICIAAAAALAMFLMRPPAPVNAPVLVDASALSFSSAAVPPNVRIDSKTIDLKPSLITADLKNVAADKIFQTIAAQSDTSFMPPANYQAADSASNLSAQFDHEPFWQAVGETCDQANLSVMPDMQAVGPRRTFRLARLPVSSRHPPACSDGIVRFQLMAVRRIGSLDFADPQSAHRDLSINLAADFEPKIAGLVLLKSTTVTRAIDDQNNSLTIDKTPFSVVRTKFTGATDLFLKFEPPKTLGRTLTTLEGEAEFIVPC